MRRGKSCWPFTVSSAIEYATFLATVGKTVKGVPKSLAYSTVLQYCGFVSQQHELQFKTDNPFASPVFHLFLHQGVHRVIGAPAQKAKPVTLPDLRALARATERDPSPRNITVLFCALLAFHCALRIANVIPEGRAVVKELFSSAPTSGRKDNAWSLIRSKHLLFHRDGLVVIIPASKTDQFRDKPHRVLVPPFDAMPDICLVRVARRFLGQVRPTDEAPVCMFGPRPQDMLTRSYFIKACRAGFGQSAPDVLHKDTQRANTTLHSFRRGWMLLACLLGVPLHESMLHGGWRSFEIALGYLESTVIASPLSKVWSSERLLAILGNRL